MIQKLPKTPKIRKIKNPKNPKNFSKIQEFWKVKILIFLRNFWVKNSKKFTPKMKNFWSLMRGSWRRRRALIMRRTVPFTMFIIFIKILI